MMLLLLAPSSPLPHSIHHLGCHLPAGQGQQDRCPCPQCRGWQAAGPSSSDTAPGEGDTLSPGRGGRAEQRPGDTDGEGPTQGAMHACHSRGLLPVPGTIHLSSAPATIDYLPVPDSVPSVTVTTPAAARHTR